MSISVKEGFETCNNESVLVTPTSDNKINTIKKSIITPTSSLNLYSIMRIFECPSPKDLDKIIDIIFVFLDLSLNDDTFNIFIRHLFWRIFRIYIGKRKLNKSYIGKKCLTAAMRLKYPDYIPSTYKNGKDIRKGAICINDQKQDLKNKLDTFFGSSMVNENISHTLGKCNYHWFAYMTSKGTLRIVYTYIKDIKPSEDECYSKLKSLQSPIYTRLLVDRWRFKLDNSIDNPFSRSIKSCSRSSSKKRVRNYENISKSKQLITNERNAVHVYKSMKNKIQPIILNENQRLIGNYQIVDRLLVYFQVSRHDIKMRYAVQPLRKLATKDIENHIDWVRRETRMSSSLVHNCMPLLRRLMEHHSNRGIFNSPVDPVKLNIPSYNEIIKKPMDLRTVKSKLEKGIYARVEEFKDDVNLVFQNAMTFNASDHYIYQNAKQLADYFKEEYVHLNAKLSDDEKKRNNHVCYGCYGQKCVVCLERCIELQIPQLFCAGNCMQTIQKNAFYYSTRDGTRICCTKCYNKHAKNKQKGFPVNGCPKNLKRAKKTPTSPTLSMNDTLMERFDLKDVDLQENESMTTIAMDEKGKFHSRVRHRSAALKEPSLEDIWEDLERRRCEVPVEPWIKCFKCSKWLHQSCGMFNIIEYSLQQEKHSFLCPFCLLEEKKNENPENRYNYSDATSLPLCSLSKYLTQKIRQKLISINESDAFNGCLIRVVTNPNEKQHVPEVVQDLFTQNAQYLLLTGDKSSYLHENMTYPACIPYTSRTVYLFQKNNGIDVCVFSMFVQEYSSDCLLPSNQSSVYIAYIDSVKYFKPAKLRTLIYHQIVIGYLDFVRKLGYKKAHIWSCPPQRNISYVFWCHPKYQKTPNADMLRSWYMKMLSSAKDDNIITNITTAYEYYFAEAECELKKEKSSDIITTKSQVSGMVTRRVSQYECDPEKCKWPLRLLPPCFDGDFWPGELCRIIKKFDRIPIRKNGYENNTNLERTPIITLSAGDRLPENDVSSCNGRRFPPKILLQEVFTAALQGVKMYKDDILVVTLNSSDNFVQNNKIEDHYITNKSPFVSQRFAFHQFCSQNNYQFDTLKRAQYSTMMLVAHMLNDCLPQINYLCNSCGLLLVKAEVWKCDECYLKERKIYANCDWCHKNTYHPHQLTFGTLHHSNIEFSSKSDFHIINEELLASNNRIVKDKDSKHNAMFASNATLHGNCVPTSSVALREPCQKKSTPATACA